MRLKSGVAKKLISPGQGISTVTKPDVLSNIRTVRYHVNPRQSLMRSQIEARRLQATGVWHDFWSKHNQEYNRRLDELQERHQGQEVPVDEMSRFYKAHMLSTRDDHREFNKWWIRENFTLLFLGIKCWFWERLPSRKEPGFFGGGH